MKKFVWSILLILLMLATNAAWAAGEKTPSLLGLQLGKSLTECGVSECIHEHYDGNSNYYTWNDYTLCWRSNSYHTDKNPYVVLSTQGFFNLAKMVSVKLNRAQNNPATDKILQVSLNFYPDSAPDLIAMLRDKYGKPAFQDFSFVQNGEGAQFKRYRVTWDFGTARIELDSRYDIQNGFIFLKPGGYEAEIKKPLEKMKSDREKL